MAFATSEFQQRVSSCQVHTSRILTDHTHWYSISSLLQVIIFRLVDAREGIGSAKLLLIPHSKLMNQVQSTQANKIFIPYST